MDRYEQGQILIEEISERIEAQSSVLKDCWTGRTIQLGGSEALDFTLMTDTEKWLYWRGFIDALRLMRFLWKTGLKPAHYKENLKLKQPEDLK